MKFKVVLALLIVLLSVGTASAIYPDWGYKRPVYINSSTNLTDFQVDVHVNTSKLISEGKLQADCDDLRFTDSSETTALDFWFSSGCNTTDTEVWVNVSDIIAPNTTIYMYYDNPDAGDGRDPDNAFMFFDNSITALKAFYSTGDEHPKGICPYGTRPNAFYYNETYNRTYFVFQTNGGDYAVSYYDHDTGDTEWNIIDGLLPGDKDHNNLGIFVDPSGYLWLIGGVHGGNAVPVKKSTNPENITSWSSWSYVGSGSATYPSMVRVSGDSDPKKLFYRNSESETKFIEYNGSAWVNNTEIAQMGANTWENKNYYIMTGAHVSSDGTIHIAIVKRETGLATWGTWKRQFYMKSSDGGDTWTKADGTSITLPGNETTLDDIYPNANGHIGADMAFTSNDSPVILWTLENHTDSNLRDWKVTKWNGTSWNTYNITNGVNRYLWNHGMIERVSGTTYDAYLVFSSEVEGGDFNIERWRSTDGGETWSKAEDVATADENAVPYQPNNYTPEFKILYSSGTPTNTTVKAYPNVTLDFGAYREPDWTFAPSQSELYNVIHEGTTKLKYWEDTASDPTSYAYHNLSVGTDTWVMEWNTTSQSYSGTSGGPLACLGFTNAPIKPFYGGGYTTGEWGIAGRDYGDGSVLSITKNEEGTQDWGTSYDASPLPTKLSGYLARTNSTNVNYKLYNESGGLVHSDSMSINSSATFTDVQACAREGLTGDAVKEKVYDYVRVRKYASDPPTTSIGAEEAIKGICGYTSGDWIVDTPTVCEQDVQVDVGHKLICEDTLTMLNSKVTADGFVPRTTVPLVCAGSGECAVFT